MFILVLFFYIKEIKKINYKKKNVNNKIAKKNKTKMKKVNEMIRND